MKRRTFLTTAALVAAATARPSGAATAAAVSTAGLIDTNVYLSDWPTRHSWARTANTLVNKLERHHVEAAWTGSFDGILQSDIAGVNARLADDCKQAGRGILIPFGTVNPMFPDWREDLRRCHEVHRMRGVRLFPGYHGYSLDHPAFAELIDLSAQRQLLVQIVFSIEDTLGQHPQLKSIRVEAAPVVDILQAFPRARVMLLNGDNNLLTTGGPLLQRMVAGGVLFELSNLEGAAGIATRALAHQPMPRLAFGSYAPFYYFESALLKLQESPLSPEQLELIRSGHARAALTWS